MKNPVLLPTSNVIVDKNSIKRHLLNEEIDPFNRKPLKLNDLIDQPELKKEIEEFIKKKLYGDKN